MRRLLQRTDWFTQEKAALLLTAIVAARPNRCPCTALSLGGTCGRCGVKPGLPLRECWTCSGHPGAKMCQRLVCIWVHQGALPGWQGHNGSACCAAGDERWSLVLQLREPCAAPRAHADCGVGGRAEPAGQLHRLAHLAAAVGLQHASRRIAPPPAPVLLGRLDACGVAGEAYAVRDLRLANNLSSAHLNGVFMQKVGPRAGSAIGGRSASHINGGGDQDNARRKGG